MSESNTQRKLMRLPPLSVIAVVEFNRGEALVLNRPLQLRYEKVGQDYIGSDGPFKDLLQFSPGSGRLKAFAGRELTVPMVDGSVVKVKDHWWSGLMPGHRSATVSDSESLARCYVFRGADILPDDLDALRATYTGCVYPYYEYEKIVWYNHDRMPLHQKLWDEQKRVKELAAQVPQHEALVQACRQLLDSRPAHMCPRNAKEREAYRAIEAALPRAEGGAA